MTLATRTKIAALLESKLDQNRGGQFELAYQAKIAVERIRFAIRQIEGGSNPELRDAAFQLTDALDRLQSADRHFQRLLPKSEVGEE